MFVPEIFQVCSVERDCEEEEGWIVRKCSLVVCHRARQTRCHKTPVISLPWCGSGVTSSESQHSAFHNLAKCTWLSSLNQSVSFIRSSHLQPRKVNSVGRKLGETRGRKYRAGCSCSPKGTDNTADIHWF